jgi:hypothetical protein
VPENLVKKKKEGDTNLWTDAQAKKMAEEENNLPGKLMSRAAIFAFPVTLSLTVPSITVTLSRRVVIAIAFSAAIPVVSFTAARPLDAASLLAAITVSVPGT